MEMVNVRKVMLSRHVLSGVAQFALYMGLFGLFYLHNKAEYDPVIWRLMILAAVCAALLTSLAPSSIAKDGILSGYIAVAAAVALFVIFAAAYCFFTWTVPPAAEFLGTFERIYLVAAPALSAIFVMIVNSRR